MDIQRIDIKNMLNAKRPDTSQILTLPKCVVFGLAVTSGHRWMVTDLRYTMFMWACTPLWFGRNKRNVHAYLFSNESEALIWPKTLICLSQYRIKRFSSCSSEWTRICRYSKCCYIHLQRRIEYMVKGIIHPKHEHLFIQDVNEFVSSSE